MIGTGVVDAGLEPEGFDFSPAERWHVLVLYKGRPAARVDMPSPGEVSGERLAGVALLRRADAEHARGELIERLRRRLGGAPPPHERLRLSVVVCTHRRSHYLPDLLASLDRLKPAPFEVIVVDNDPGTEDCRALVEGAGFRYLREDRRGLDNARNTGLRAARGDVVVYTDDDVVLSPAWLASLDRAFAHEGVVAVTGPAFPYLLDTPARVRMERQASLARGFGRVSFDWQVISPLHAAAMGVGANMAIRRSCLLGLGPEPFPPELDAGTETESGGDTYVLSRLLAGGGRVVYDPEMFVFHQHRPDGPALRKAVLGYGIGLSASLTKLVVEDRELTAPRAWLWLVKQYLKTQRRRAVGRADAVETRVSWDYLRGGFLGSARWRRALATQAVAGAGGPTAVEAPASAQAEEPSVVSEAPAAGGPAISVIVPTYRREDALRRGLEALAAQDVAPGTFEVVVVDDDDQGGGTPAPPHSGDRLPFELRRVGNSGQGAAAARNHGARVSAAPLMLFLDDDVVADPWLVRRHLEWHREHEDGGVLVGSYRPRPTRDNLAAAVARLWWQDFFDLLEESPGMTFVGALSANMSIPRAAFERVGEFSEDYARARREDWEWGLRVRKSGLGIEFDRSASARHEFTLETSQRLRDSRREGFGDTLIARDHPEALAALPLPSMRPVTPTRPLRWVGFWLWRQDAVRRLVVWTLGLLELGNLREAWARLFRLAQSAAYAQGAQEGGWRAPQTNTPGQAGPMDLELLSDEPIEPPAVVAPSVRILIRGEEVALVAPTEGVWAGGSLAEQIADAMAPDAVARAAALGGWLPGEESGCPHGGEVEVLFGPSSPPSDRDRRAELESCGALVRVAEGDPSLHWESVVAAAGDGNRPLLAFPLPGTCPGGEWLSEALAAFDGKRVGLVFGAALGDGDLPAPLYLHDRQSADASLFLRGQGPAYLVIRRELLPALVEAGGPLEGIVTALRKALGESWVIGHRSTKGLRPPDYRSRRRGEAYGRVEARAAAAAGGRDTARIVGRELSRGLLTIGWQALKRRGRLGPQESEIAAGIAAGAAAELSRRSSTSAGGR